MCRLSIVIPLLGDMQLFEDTLVSVLQNRPAHCEVLVVHCGRYDDPYELRGEVNFIPLRANSNLLEASNAGIEAARGEIIHLVQPGVLAEEGWTNEVLNRFRDPAIAAVSPVLLNASDRNRIVAAGVRYTIGGRRVLSGAGQSLAKAARTLRREIVGPPLMAAFYRRSVVKALGGLCPKAGAWHADIDLALSMRRLGFRCELEPGSIMATLNAGFVPPVGFETARCAERVFWKNWRQCGGTLALLAHAAHVTATACTQPHRVEAYTQLAGRFLAGFERSTFRQHQKRLQRAAETCSASDEVPGEDDDTAVILSLSEYRRRMAA